jgi:hypothetical protein
MNITPTKTHRTPNVLELAEVISQNEGANMIRMTPAPIQVIMNNDK